MMAEEDVVNFIYVVVVYSLNKRKEPKEIHNHGWWKELDDAKEYMELAGTPAGPPGSNSFYEDPFEIRWDYAMIERVSEGSYPETEVMAHYKAEWYKDPDYEYDESVTELVNKMRATKFRVVELDEAPFDASQACNFSGM